MASKKIQGILDADWYSPIMQTHFLKILDRKGPLR